MTLGKAVAKGGQGTQFIRAAWEYHLKARRVKVHLDARQDPGRSLRQAQRERA